MVRISEDLKSAFKNGDKTCAYNYREIYLTSVTHKILSRVVKNKIEFFVLDKQIQKWAYEIQILY